MEYLGAMTSREMLSNEQSTANTHKYTNYDFKSSNAPYLSLSERLLSRVCSG
jgi:hypothetical protein